MYFDGNDTLVLNSPDSFDVLSPFSVCLWVHTEDLDSVLLESGRFSIIVSDGFLYGQVRIGGTWRQTESMVLPSGQWFHLILLWDGNKVKLYKNNELVATPLNASGNLTGSTAMYLGGRDLNEPYIGLIDDLRILIEHYLSLRGKRCTTFPILPLLPTTARNTSIS